MSNPLIWKRWFALRPVTVDAYDVSEIRDQKFRYRVWLRWVDRAFDHDAQSYRYRLPRTIACPYCPNPDRDSVFDCWLGCQYDRKADEARGIVGADPPCVCDEYPTEKQLKRLGLSN